MTLNPTNVNVTTAGDHTLTTDEVLAGFITRTGPGGGFTDTLPATSAIASALQADTPFEVVYINASGQTATIAAGDASTTIVDGAGMLGATTIATHQQCRILFTPAGSVQAPTLTATLLSRSTLV